MNVWILRSFSWIPLILFGYIIWGAYKEKKRAEKDAGYRASRAPQAAPLIRCAEFQPAGRRALDFDIVPKISKFLT